MNLLSSGSDFFGLDIGSSALRVVQMKGGKTKTLIRYGSLAVDPKITRSDANVDMQKLASAISEVVSSSGVTTKNVAVGIPSDHTFLTVVDIDRLNPKELDQTIRLQADSMIPTPLSESKIDWALLGDSPKEKSKVEVLLSSVSNSFIEKRLDLVESVGLNVVAFEPDSLALTRSLLSAESVSAQVIIDMGEYATDLIITSDTNPHLVRSIPTGSETMIKAASQNLGIDAKQAEQFVYKFGLNQNKLEGQIYNALSGSIENLTSEIDKSMKFFQTRYPDKKIDRIVVTGAASVLPEFPLMLANKFAIEVEIGNAWRNVAFASEQQNELLQIANKFSVASGLAQRSSDT